MMDVTMMNNRLIQLVLIVCFCTTLTTTGSSGGCMILAEAAEEYDVISRSLSQPKIGIVGGGAAGITAAYLLSKLVFDDERIATRSTHVN